MTSMREREKERVRNSVLYEFVNFTGQTHKINIGLRHNLVGRFPQGICDWTIMDNNGQYWTIMDNEDSRPILIINVTNQLDQQEIDHLLAKPLFRSVGWSVRRYRLAFWLTRRDSYRLYAIRPCSPNEPIIIIIILRVAEKRERERERERERADGLC